MTLRRTRGWLAAALVGILAASVSPTALAHGPDPGMAWPLFNADSLLKYKWKENEVPPPKMRDAVIAASDDT